MNWLRRFGAWVFSWRDLFGVLPIAFALLVVAFYVLQAVAPRSGLDGFGGLWNALVVALCALIAGFVAWLLLDLYHYSPRDKDERELIDHACGMVRSQDGGAPLHGTQSWPAVVVYVWHQVLWLATFSAVLYFMLR